MSFPKPRVVSVSSNSLHEFSKIVKESITLAAGIGVVGDAHAGRTVQHRFDKQKNPSKLNLRQCHLIQGELFDDLHLKGFQVFPGDLGENVTTRNINLLVLPKGARLHVGKTVVLEVTGLRNPCFYIDRFRKGLLRLVRDTEAGDTVYRRAGIMTVVSESGTITSGDEITVEMPSEPHQPLSPV